jgi:DNA-nicking Smr family endonuclease
MQDKPADADSGLWERATRDAVPLRPRLRPPAPPASSPTERTRELAAAPPVLSSTPPLDRFAGIDRANAERLKRGQHRIEARLDLHGMTQDEAHRALGVFIRGARAAGRRCVLVIHGRGSAKGPDGGAGVLRAAVPRWLAEAELRPHLLAIATAQPRDGGAGALYVMLRRNAAVNR